MAQFPEWYSTSADFTLTTGGSQKKTIGFNAQTLRIFNTGSTFLYANLKGGAATTADMEVRNASEVKFDSLPFPVAEVSFFHPNFATTTTADAMSANLSAARSL